MDAVNQTQEESRAARERTWKRKQVLDVITEAANRNDPVCNADIERITGLPWSHCTAAVNYLMLTGAITLVPDPNGKTHKLKRLIGGKRVTVSVGPWVTKENPKDPRNKGRVLIWVPSPNRVLRTAQ